MKQLKKLEFIKDVKILNAVQMKSVKAGAGGAWCHCKGESSSHETSSCDKCGWMCGEKGVQNCNTIQ